MINANGYPIPYKPSLVVAVLERGPRFLSGDYTITQSVLVLMLGQGLIFSRFCAPPEHDTLQIASCKLLKGRELDLAMLMSCRYRCQAFLALLGSVDAVRASLLSRSLQATRLKK